jgi:hypothetical protein
MKQKVKSLVFKNSILIHSIWTPKTVVRLLLPVLERLSSSGSLDQEEDIFVSPHNISSADTLSIPGTEPMPSLNPEV